MTIRRGENWGVSGEVPAGTVVAEDDAGLFVMLNSPDPPHSVAVCTGDLARTVSASPDPQRYRHGNTVVLAPLDLLEVQFDSGSAVCVSHIVARRGWLRGTVVVVANAQFLGRWDVAPRSHPNDGRFDATEVRPAMSVRQRLIASRRLPTGSHLPHPDLLQQRSASGEWTFARPLTLWLDGVRVGRTRRVRVQVVPDALTLCI